MTVNLGDRKEFSTASGSGGRTARMRRAVLSLAAAASICGGLLIATSQGAGASTPATTYNTFNWGCTGIAGYYGTLDFGRPTAVANYTGTSRLTWVAMIEVVQNGRWVNYEYISSYSTIWGHSGTQLTPIYWNNTANNYATGVNVPTGHTYRVVAATGWTIGATNYDVSQVLLSCSV